MRAETLKARISSYSDYELPSSCQSGFLELFRSITECFFSMWQIRLCSSYKQCRIVPSTTSVRLILMTRSPLLDFFDPFAIHPFTNNSGLEPPPPLPSPYPPSISPIQSMNSLSSESLTHSSPKLQKQPVSPPSSPQANAPIFVPFRVDTPSPDLELDLILKKNPKWSPITRTSDT